VKARGLPRRIGRGWVTMGVAAVGILLSALGFAVAQRADRDRAIAVLNQRGEYRAHEFQRKLLLAAETVEGLAIYRGAEGEVSAARFHAYAKLAHVPDDLNAALYWSPLVRDFDRDAFVALVRRQDGDPDYDIREIASDERFVSAARRDAYLPLRYEESYDGTPGIAGFDLLFRPELRAEVARLRDTGAPLATPPYQLLMGGKRVAGFLILWPVYGKDGAPPTVDERRTAFQGVATARFRLDRFLPAAIADTQRIEEAIEIFIGADADQVRPVAWFNPATQSFIFDSAFAPESEAGITIRRTFSVLDQTWVAAFHFPPAVTARLRSNGPFAWLVAGLLLTAIVGAFAWRQMTSMARAEAQMSRQAGELVLWDDVFRNAAFGIAVVDAADEKVRFGNPAFAAMLGMTAEEVRGMPIWSIYPDDERARLSAVIGTWNQTGTMAFESRHIRKDGSTYPVQVHLTIVRDASGVPLYRIGSVFDISARRKTEAQLHQAQKMEAVGNLTGGMAHDFNNLLGIIGGNLELAAPLVEGRGEAAELIDAALQAVLRGAELTRRLLAFARRQPLQPRPVDINLLVSEMTRLLGRTLGENIEIALDLGSDVWPIVVDPAQLESALVNLATNARDAMPSGGRLMIATGNRTLDADYAAGRTELVPGDYVMIEVSDSGIGMSPQVMRQIFEPFFTTKEVGKGTGLGLSMVFGFIKQSGGHTDVYSEPGVGTTLRLYLPRAKNGLDKASTPDSVAAVGACGETVLVVEDNEALRRVVVRQLKQLGYRVIAVERAAAALAVLESEHVDLLFTDIVMPGEMDGFALAERVLADRPGIKILLTSGFPEARVNGKSGALAPSVRLLSKPYRKEELARLLRELFEGRTTAP
jgi:PAS domain S-box-containing protein